MSTLTAAAAAINWTRRFSPASGRVLCLAYGQIWMNVGNAIDGYAIHGYEQVTGKLTYKLRGFGGVPLNAAPFLDGLMVLSNDGNIYKTEIESRAAPYPIGRYDFEPGWVRAQGGSVYLFAVKTGLWRVSPNDGGKVIGGVSYAKIFDFPVLAPDAVLVSRAPNFIDAIDPVTLAVSSTIELPDFIIKDKDPINGACDGPVACFGFGGEDAVIAIDTIRRKKLWQTEANAKLAEGIAVDAKSCYVGTQDGRLLVLDIVTGKPVSELRLGTGRIDWISQDEGLVYATGEESSNKYCIYAADPQTGTVVRHGTLGRPGIVGIDNGVVYYSDGKVLGAVRLADIVREFYAESVLVQDFTFSADKEEKRPSIHTEITLYDRSGAPFAMQTVVVGSTSPITIESGNASYAIGPESTAMLKTDGSGKLRIDMRAGDVDSKGEFRSGLTSPSLTLLTSFMDPGDRILIRPDAQMHNQLREITREQLQCAKGYDGNFVVNDKYRDDKTAMTNVIGMIDASINMVKESLDNRKMLLAAQSQRYLAHGCDMETICCCKVDDYACKLVCNKAFAFGLDSDGSSFGYLENKEQIERWLKNHPVSHESLLMSWGDFWDAVKSGAAKITNAIVYAAKQVEDKASDVVKTVITAIVNDIKMTMAFVVDTVEHALGIIQGIFNEIAGAIDKVIEALSLVFDWKDTIIPRKNEIKNNIETAFDRLLKPQTPGGQTLLTQARGKGNQAFADMRDKLDQAFDALNGRIGKESGSDLQRRSSGKNNPAKGGAASNWLQSKMTDNLLGEQAMKSDALTGAPGSAIRIPEFTLKGDLQNEITGFINSLESKMTGDVNTTIERLRGALESSSGDLFSGSFEFFLELVRGTLRVGLDVAGAVFDEAMRLLEKLLSEVWTFIKDQSVSIPFISDLYRSVTGSELTPLDLGCLLIALPGSLAIAALPAGRSALLGAVKVSGVLGGIAQVVWSLVGGLVGAEPKMPGLLRAFLILTVGGAARGLLLWSDIDTFGGDQDALENNVVLWCLPSLAVFADLIAVPSGLRLEPELVAMTTAMFACAAGVWLVILLLKFSLSKQMPAIPIIVFNGLVAVGLVLRLVAMAPQLRPYAACLSILFVALSGAVKIMGAVGVFSADTPAPVLRRAV